VFFFVDPPATCVSLFMSGPDAELMQRWQQGDLSAFEQLVRRWQQPIGRFILGMVGHADLVGDLSQEVFLRLYRAGPRYRENGAFAGWLYRIAQNVVRDSARRRPAEILSLHDREVPDARPTADAVCQTRELSQVIAQALAELPEPQRLVLVLHHYEQMNFEEIARLTHTPASTLKSRFAAALNRLRLRLRELGYGPTENDR
jgi:RNA polymerase sigma-70 factor (ECF subfamily)